MINLIHGENIPISRKYFIDFKQTLNNIIYFEGASLTLINLIQATQGLGLFANPKDIFIEEFLSLRKANNESEAILKYISENSKTHNFIIWESKKLTPAQLNKFKNAKVKLFDYPKIIFNFLDNLKPENGKNAILIFHQLLQTEEAELIFYMIVRHFRILLALSDPTTEPIDEILRLSDWQKSKLNNQSRVFGRNALIEIYSELFDIEKKVKTGLLVVKLEVAIDFLLIRL